MMFTVTATAKSFVFCRKGRVSHSPLEIITANDAVGTARGVRRYDSGTVHKRGAILGRASGGG
jgi:hypothetical protein